jgi:hypothetical protein
MWDNTLLFSSIFQDGFSGVAKANFDGVGWNDLIWGDSRIFFGGQCEVFGPASTCMALPLRGSVLRFLYPLKRPIQMRSQHRYNSLYCRRGQ